MNLGGRRPGNHRRLPLIIPVENQVRELEPKLLLACIAARRGFPAIIGSRLEVDFHIASLPRGVYLSKSMTQRSVKMFGIMRQLGHEIVAWDEEALVHPPAVTYFNRRLSPSAMRHVSQLFAWGDENAKLWRSYPHYEETPIHTTGNPRGDVLRPELQGYYADEAAHWRRTYGDFLLVNTNFGFVNAFNPGQNLFYPEAGPAGERRIAPGSVGMDRAFAEGLHAHKQALFEHFQRLVPALERAFPDLNIVIRPHPVERPEVYREIAARSRRVFVTNEGNIIPWLMAVRAVIHNGCTTGIEAFTLQVPAIAYQPVTSEFFDAQVYRLPNRLSHECFAFDELCATVESILAGTLGAAGGEERRTLLAPFLCAQSGLLASERIVARLADEFEMEAEIPQPPLRARLDGWRRATKRRLIKKLKGCTPGSKYRAEFQRHRYPGLTLDQMRERVARFLRLLGDPQPLQVERLGNHIYRIAA